MSYTHIPLLHGAAADGDAEPHLQAANVTPEFKHSPLEGSRSIRILKLMPAIFGERLRCHLANVSLDDQRNCVYEALSYTWGPPSLDCAIICNGKELHITANCEAALRRFRWKFRSRSLWVDSISIDQTSI